MASVDTTTNNPNDPNNPNNQAGNVNQVGQQQTNQPATTGGGAGPVTATGAGNVTGQVVGTNNPSQPFQNISSYLAANAPQSQQLAQQVAGTVSQPITQAGTDITNAANQFQTSVNAGYTPENSNVIQSVADSPSAAVAQGPQTINDFLANYNDSYGGPSSFTEAPTFANLQSEVANANTLAANTQTQPGVQTLLRQTEGPGATQGINNLDALLLNLNPANLSTIQAAGAPAAGLTPALTAATTAGNQQATDAQTAAQKAQNDAKAAITSATGNLTNRVNTQAQDAAQMYIQNQNTLNDYIKGISQPGLSGLKIQQLIRAGVDPTVIQAYTGLPTVTQAMTSSWNGLPTLGNAPGSTEWTFPTAGPAPTTANTATSQDYADLAALMQLTGGQNISAPISSSTAGQAGTFQNQNLMPSPNNTALAQDLMNYLMPWAAPKGVTPIGGMSQNSADAEYASLMNGIAAYLGLPPFNTNYPTPPPPDGGGGGGPPFGGV